MKKKLIIKLKKWDHLTHIVRLVEQVKAERSFVALNFLKVRMFKCFDYVNALFLEIV